LEVPPVEARREFDVGRFHGLCEEIGASLPDNLAVSWKTVIPNMTVPVLCALREKDRVRPGFIALALELGFLETVRYEEWLLKCIGILDAKLGFMTMEQVLGDSRNFIYDLYFEAFEYVPRYGRENNCMPTNLMPVWKWRRDRDLTPQEFLLLVQDLGYEDENKDPYLRDMLYELVGQYVEMAGEIAIRRNLFGFKRGIDYVLNVTRRVRARLDAAKEEDYAALVYESTDLPQIVGDNEDLRKTTLELLRENIKEKGLREVLISIYWHRNGAGSVQGLY
jgi:hypothetical protein